MSTTHANGIHGSLLGLTALVSVALISACSGSRSPSTSLEPPAPTDTSAAYGPQPSERPSSRDNSTPSDGATVAQSADDESAPEAAEAAKPVTGRRADGRPSWWIDDPERAGGEVLIAAEALGPDIRAARRAAIDAGVTRLARELGHAPSDWVVKATIIRPLRAVRGPENVNRFVGYVLVAATE